MLQRPILFLSLIFLMSCSSQKAGEKKVSPTKLNVMAYYFPREEFNPEELQLDKLTHIIYSFTHVIDGKMQFDNARNDGRLKQLVAQKENYLFLFQGQSQGHLCCNAYTKQKKVCPTLQ